MAQSLAAKVLRDARERSGASQRALAQSGHTSQSVVGRIEAGLASPSLDTLARLVNAAGFELTLRLEPKAAVDSVVEAYKPGIDQTLLVANLRRNVEERLRANMEFDDFAGKLRAARVLKVAEGTQ